MVGRAGCAAVVYLIVVQFDFAVEPVLCSIMHHSINPLSAMDAVAKLSNPATPLEAIKIMAGRTEWQPITMGDGASPMPPWRP